MKRAMPWSDEDDDSTSSSSQSDVEADKEKPTKTKLKSGKQNSGVTSFEALRQHGYKGGLSVLSVPPPKEDVKQDWSWSNGKENREATEVEESYEERQKTRAAVVDGQQLANVHTRKDKKNLNLSFSQKEKRKRELGQSSRAKNYVEEEKRMLRESGIYSGFDT
ncbi:hypothetical protein CFOL_v3_21850 [Cephalotus follicularis]|uniref:Uncharacterized protein n=1 Tax=Cephalotus follicularis TaxID=3775 RepID=A0A1Q3CE22_CEPFO|nr:hypothetical protein CFOL_v3_21850 [Cephalotus follicularis]